MIQDQPPPTPRPGGDIQSLVIQDLTERREVGIARYGTPLQAHNGRDAMVDAYQEALDLCCYLRQVIEERSPEPPLFYIFNRGQVAGNDCLWWGPNSGGYVCDLAKAGRYTAEEAVRICRDGSQAIAYPVEVVDRLAVRHVAWPPPPAPGGAA